MVAINETKGEPKTQPGVINMFFGNVMCPYCRKSHFRCIFYYSVPGRVQCRKCKRIFEITLPVTVACNRINRGTRDRN